MNIKNLWEIIKMKSKLLQKKIEQKENEVAPPKQTEEANPLQKESAPVEKEDNTLNLTAYDIIRDPEKGGNNFIAVEIKYNLKTKKTSFIAKPYFDKTSGLSMFMDKENRKYLFEKNRGVKK